MSTKHKPGPLEALWQQPLKRERKEQTASDDAPVNSNAASNSTAALMSTKHKPGPLETPASGSTS